MVSGHGIAEHRQHARPFNIFNRFRLARHIVKERRQANIGRALVPRIGGRFAHFDRLPLFGAVEHLGVLFMEHVAGHLLHRRGDLFRRRPDILQENVPALRILPQRLGLQINLHIARQRVGDHQRRRRQPVGFHQRMDTAFEVAVAGEHGADGQIALFNRGFNLVGQRPGVTDTGGAAVAHQVEAELVEIRRQLRDRQIVGNHFGTRRQRGFHPGLTLQAALNRFFRQQPRRHQHARVRGVGAGGNGADHHGAVLDLMAETGAAVGIGDRFMRRLAVIHLQLVAGVERGRHIAKGNAILRTFGAGDTRFYAIHIQRQRTGEDRLVARIAPKPLGFGVGFHQRDLLGIAPGERQIAQRDVVDREESAGCAIFRRHIGDSRAIGQRQIRQTVAVELYKLADHAMFAQHLGHGQH